MSDTIADLDKGTAINHTLSFSKDSSGVMTLNVSTDEATFNKISHYVEPEGNEIIDGWIAADFDFNASHTKELVIEEEGNEVDRKVVPTWDVTEIFGLTVKEEWKKSGFQASIPEEHADKKAFLVVKDDSGKEISKQTIN